MGEASNKAFYLTSIASGGELSFIVSGGLLFANFFFVSDGILFANSSKKYAKNAARNPWFLDFLYLQELRSLWAVKGIGSAIDPLPLPLR